jgi:hypothetical protein
MEPGNCPLERMVVHNKITHGHNDRAPNSEKEEKVYAQNTWTAPRIHL